MNRRVYRSVLLYSALTLAVASPSWALNLANFRDCIGDNRGNWGSWCQLDQGWYGLTETLVVKRSYITVAGTYITGRYNTWLARSSASMWNIMRLNPGVTNITIRDFLFDGNRCGLFGGGLYNPCQGYWPAACSPPNNPNQDYIDLDLNPLGQTQNVVVMADFQFAPNYSIELTNYTSVYYSWFPSNHNSPIAAHYAERPAVYPVIQNNTFQDNGGSAIALSHASSVQIGWNYMSNNHKEMPVERNPGGQIFLGSGVAPGSAIYRNTLNGNNVDGSCVGLGPGPGGPGMFTFGIEGHASGHWILGNVIWNHKASGIWYPGPPDGLYILEDGYGVGNNIQYNGLDGIEVFQYSGTAVPRNIWIRNSTISNNGYWTPFSDPQFGYGVAIYVTPPSCITSGEIHLINNTIQNNRLGATWINPLCP